MNKITTIAFAGALGIIALACGYTGPALAQAAVDYKPGELLPAVMPTDQRGDFIAAAYGDVLGRPAGEENGLIGLLNQEKTGGMPTDQRANYVAEAYGGVLGRDTSGGENGLIGLLHQQMPTDQLPAVQKVGSLGSLASLGSIGDLFPLSRGDNGGTGLLLPAVQKPVTGAADKALLPAVKPGNGSTNAGLLPAVLPAAGAGGGPHVAPGAVKGLNFTNTGRK